VYERLPKSASAAFSVDERASSPMSPAQMLDWQEDVDARFSWSMERAKELGMLKKGDNVIGVQGWRGGAGNTSVMRLLVVE
jgi:pyruvate kinase